MPPTRPRCLLAGRVSLVGHVAVRELRDKLEIREVRDREVFATFEGRA